MSDLGCKDFAELCAKYTPTEINSFIDDTIKYINYKYRNENQPIPILTTNGFLIVSYHTNNKRGERPVIMTAITEEEENLLTIIKQLLLKR